MTIPTFWQRCLDVILPPALESRAIRKETTTTFAYQYRPRHRQKILLLSHYQDPVVQATVQANKFYGDRHASRLLASVLHHYLTHRYTNCPELIQIVPIPLSSNRYKSRGYNQINVVLAELTRMTTLPFSVVSALKRPVDTKPQSHLARQERLKNVTGAFATTRALAKLDPARPIWLLDDVATTGATLHAASRALPQTLKKKVELIALAG